MKGGRRKMEIKIPGSYAFRFCHNIVYIFLFFLYCSMIPPYLAYGLVSWGQAANSYQHKLLVSATEACPLFNLFF